MSATSDAGSMVEGFGLTMVSTTPDEQSQVFMVLGEDVSKSVVSSILCDSPANQNDKICYVLLIHSSNL